jgi:predicted nucleotidyltransferase
MPYTLDDIQRMVVPIIQQDAKDLRRVIVFGSYAQGTQTPDSDLDLYVDGILEYHSEDILDTEQKVSEALSLPVDLITRSALENSVVREKLKNNIEQFGYVLYG